MALVCHRPRGGHVWGAPQPRWHPLIHPPRAPPVVFLVATAKAGQGWEADRWNRTSVQEKFVFSKDCCLQIPPASPLSATWPRLGPCEMMGKMPAGRAGSQTSPLLPPCRQRAGWPRCPPGQPRRRPGAVGEGPAGPGPGRAAPPERLHERAAAGEGRPAPRPEAGGALQGNEAAQIERGGVRRGRGGTQDPKVLGERPGGPAALPGELAGGRRRPERGN